MRDSFLSVFVVAVITVPFIFLPERTTSNVTNREGRDLYLRCRAWKALRSTWTTLSVATDHFGREHTVTSILKVESAPNLFLG